MSWKDRLREAAYVSPSGIRITFDYEDVRRTVEKKTSAFEFNGANGTYIQDLGNTSKRYPFRVFFWGDNYDIAAQNFEVALLEEGIGKLEHPIYGVINVVPFGEITRRDDLKTAANQAVIDVKFWETIGLIYPTSQDDPASEIVSSVDNYNQAMSQQFSDYVGSSNITEQTSLKGSYNQLLDNARNILRPIADTQDNVRTQFDSIYDSINAGIDVIIAEPLTLGFQTTLLLQSPSRALTNISSRLSAYSNLTSSIISGNDAILEPGYNSVNSNLFHTRNLYASTYVTGSIISVINNEFLTRNEALQSAELILEQMDDTANWQDANFQSLDELDTGESYQQLHNMVALAAGFLVQTSFSLQQQRSIVLDRDRTIIDVCAELYQSIDKKLEFFISSNNLSGDEILELPKGRKIVYYI